MPVETIGQANSILIESHRSHLPAKRFVPPRHLCFAKTKWRHFQEQPQHGAQRRSRGQHTLVCSAAFQRTHHQTLDTTSTVYGYCVGCGTVGSSRYVAASLRSITNSMCSSVPWSPPSVPSGARTLVVCRVQGRTTEATYANICHFIFIGDWAGGGAAAEGPQEGGKWNGAS